MNFFRHDLLLRVQAIARTLKKVPTLIFILTALAAAMLAQNTRQPIETGQQRANETKSNKTNEFDADAACSSAHAYMQPPQKFSATPMPSKTSHGIVTFQWTPVPGLDSSAGYVVSFQINGTGAPTAASPLLANNVSSFTASNLPVFYPLKFSISTVKKITVNWRFSATLTRTMSASCSGPADYYSNLVTPLTTAQLTGFVDLHAHPVSNLAFGGKLIYGGVDVGALLPANANCQHAQVARSEQEALGYDKTSHGGPGPDNLCGDPARRLVVHNIQLARKANDPGPDAHGYPDFTGWPKWNDVTHQKMWVNWIKRAYQGGLRVMVALAVNNKSLGDITAGPGDFATDDKSSADLQIAEIQAFVGRHPDFMEVAYNSPDVYRIVAANKLAVIVGIEVDHIGNFQVALFPNLNPNPPSDAAVRAEMDRLYGEGVRYIFPIHLLDNAFGGAAAYVDEFNTSNQRESGRPFALVCADPIKYPATDADLKDQASGGYTYGGSLNSVGAVMKNGPDYGLSAAVQVSKTGWAPPPPVYPSCPLGIGQKNSLGLTRSGGVAIQEMMRLGMLIDIDHMSQAAADQTLQIATQAQYPVSTGHNGLRGALTTNHDERALRADQYRTIGRLHGMAGVGSAELNAQQWLTLYQNVMYSMQGSLPFVIAGAFGTDMNGLEKGMPPRPGSSIAGQYGKTLPQSTEKDMIWNYDTDGVAHYGMLWDFLQDVQSLSSGAGRPSGKQTVDSFMTGADYFFHTWQIAEATRDRNLGTRPHE